MSETDNNGLTARQAGPFAAFALPIFKQGYDPVLIAPRDKVPLLKAWTTYTRHMSKADLHLPESVRGLHLSENVISGWSTAVPDANLGVMTGSGRGELTGFDVDSVDTAVVNIVMSVLPQSPVMKFAKKGFTPLFRNDGTVKSRPLIGVNGARLADVLAGGRQTVIPPSIHPEGMLYQWTPGHAALWDVHISALPLLSQAHIDEIVARLLAGGLMPHPKPPMVLVPADIEHVRANRARYVGNARVKLAERARQLEATPAGGRREAVNGLGYAMGPHVLHGLIEEAEVWHAVLAACERNGKLGEVGGYHDISRELARALAKGAAKLPLPMLRDKTAADAFAGQAPQQMPALARVFAPDSNVVQMHKYALPPAPAVPMDGMGTARVVDGVVTVDYSHVLPQTSQDGQFSPAQLSAVATAAATWSQPQTGAAPLPGLPQPAAQLAEVIHIKELLKTAAPPREWTVPGWVPHKQVTLVSGDGGIGKTTIMMQLAFALASGTRPWLGMMVAQRKVLFVSGEDEKDELHFRLQEVAKSMNLDPDNVVIMPLDGLESPELVTFDKDEMQVKPIFWQIVRVIIENNIGCVMLDPVADLFGGDEIKRLHVRKFIGLLRKQIAVPLNCSVLLSAHPSVDAMKTERGYSGSTAWNNSVRSRLYFTVEDPKEAPHVRSLIVKKANRGQVGVKIDMTWKNGIFVQSGGSVGTVDEPETDAMAVFMKLLVKFNGQGRAVSHLKGRNFAPTMFAEDEGAQGIKPKAFAVAMGKLFNSDQIQIVMDGPASRQRASLWPKDDQGLS